MTLRMRVLPRFPANIKGTNGIAVVREGVDLIAQPNYGELVRIPSVPDRQKTYFMVWYSELNTYSIMTFGDVFDAVVDDIVADGIMLASTYDPQGIAADVFLRTNHPANPGHLSGLQLANNAVDAVNDIDISTGECASDAVDSRLMILSAGMTKRLDSAWVVGSGNGGLDTGAISNATYHVFLIQRSDTGVVDVLLSLSATAPTMPANYNRKRRIGSILREAGSVVAFVQTGDLFLRKLPVLDFNAVVPASALTPVLSVPTGIKVLGKIRCQLNNASTIGGSIMLVTSLDESDRAPNVTAGDYNCQVPVAGVPQAFIADVMTSTAALIRCRSGNASNSFQISTYGWVDQRRP